MCFELHTICGVVRGGLMLVMSYTFTRFWYVKLVPNLLHSHCFKNNFWASEASSMLGSLSLVPMQALAQLPVTYCKRQEAGWGPGNEAKVHSGWGGGRGYFSTILKLPIRSRSITAVHLALNSHINTIWRLQRHAMYFWLVTHFQHHENPSWSLPHSISDCCIDGF